MSFRPDDSTLQAATIETATIEPGCRIATDPGDPDRRGGEPPGRSRRRYELAPWDISELIESPTEEVISRQLAAIEEAIAGFEGVRERLRPDLERDEFLAIVRDYEGVYEHLDVVAGYANLWFASNTQSAAAVGFRNRVRQVIAEVQNRMLFFELWWQELEEAAAEALLPPADGTQLDVDYRYHLLELRRFKPYTLDERSEQLINTKNTNGIEAVLTLYSMITNRFEFDLEVEGERQSLTEGEMRGLFYAPDPKLREKVYGELFGVYEREAQVLAQVYANRARDWHEEYVRLRGFRAPISVRNLRNDVPDVAVEALLGVVHRNAPVFQDYFELKGRWLGIEPLRRYDLYAPLAASSEQVPYSDAVEQVLDTFAGFDERFGELGERVFAQRHIDAEIRKGKRSGAFCSTVRPDFTPWVMLNYTGKVRDVATLAHELGHAVHSMLADHHSSLTQHPPLPLAETASVFSEMLMTERLLAGAQDPVTRRELLAAAVDDIYATVMRQAFFVRFEVAAHQAIQENRSADDLFELYLENLGEQFGDTVTITPEFRYEWLSIPHLYQTPFYCYSYSFGQLLVLALYRRYQEEGAAFKPGYFRLLSYGGAARPEEALREIGIDITDPDFWQGGFEVVRGMIEELKSIEIP